MRVAAFPSIDRLCQNPYWQILNAELGKLGVEIIPTSYFSRSWLRDMRGKVEVLHFHYIQQFYAYEEARARLRWVLRMARNYMLARNWGYHTVFTLHNLRPTYPLRPEWVDFFGHWLTARLANTVIVHCESAREALAMRFGRRRGVRIIHHPHFIGVYENSIDRERARATLNLKPEHRVFLFFGGIRPNKGLEELLEAFGRVPGKSLRLIIAGKPWPPEDYIRRLEALATMDERVELSSQFIPDNEIQTFFKAADAVVLPFQSILTSSSTILAMSFAQPVITPAIGCLPELVTPETGISYDPSRENALQSALEQAIERDLEAMGAKARRRVRTFTPRDFAVNTAVAYRMEQVTHLTH